MTLWFHRRVFLRGAIALAILPVRQAFADEPILRVLGLTAVPAGRSFTLSQLEAEPHVSFATKTPWHADVTTFEGIGLDRLFELVGATGRNVRITALNDYVVEADIADMKGRRAILAYRENGRTMPIDDKGPLFIVFPFDSDEDLQHQSIYARCVWQISTIEIF